MSMIKAAGKLITFILLDKVREALLTWPVILPYRRPVDEFHSYIQILRSALSIQSNIHDGQSQHPLVQCLNESLITNIVSPCK